MIRNQHKFSAAEADPGPTLDDAFAQIADLWPAKGAGAAMLTDGRAAIGFLRSKLGRVYVSDVTCGDLAYARRVWAKAGVAPEARKRRRGILTALGVSRVSTAKAEARKKSTPTFDEALDAALAGRWARIRSRDSTRSQCRAAIAALHELGRTRPADVTQADLDAIVSQWLAAGKSDSTVSHRVVCLGVLGVKVERRPRVARPRRWYLRPEDEERLAHCPRLDPLALLFVRWTCSTGLRVEESLRLRWRDITADEACAVVNVPGTKSANAEATNALSAEALAVLIETRTLLHGTMSPDPASQVFPMRYWTLRKHWNIARKFLGYADVPTATLKALRRSFARRAHLKGMPVDVLRQYLRHGNLKTTQGYLNLVGGYSVDEQRRWL